MNRLLSNKNMLGYMSAGAGLLSLLLCIFIFYLQNNVSEILVFIAPLLSLIALIAGKFCLNKDVDQTTRLLGSIGILTGLPAIFIFIMFIGLLGI